MSHRNPFANRRPLGARQLRRATAASPRQQARAVGRLKAVAAKQIKEGLREKLTAAAEGSP
jgi:hypothetical protein